MFDAASASPIVPPTAASGALNMATAAGEFDESALELAEMRNFVADGEGVVVRLGSIADAAGARTEATRLASKCAALLQDTAVACLAEAKAAGKITFVRRVGPVAGVHLPRASLPRDRAAIVERIASIAAFRADEAPAERPAKRPAERPAERPAKRPAKRPAERPTKRPAERTAKRPAERTAERPTNRPAERGSGDGAGDEAGATANRGICWRPCSHLSDASLAPPPGVVPPPPTETNIAHAYEGCQICVGWHGMLTNQGMHHPFPMHVHRSGAHAWAQHSCRGSAFTACVWGACAVCLVCVCVCVGGEGRGKGEAGIKGWGRQEKQSVPKDSFGPFGASTCKTSAEVGGRCGCDCPSRVV
eukprot:363192-Chlamydomonas_euryale.AAC.21